MRYLPHTHEEIEAMLAVVGKASLDELFEPLGAAAAHSRPLDLPPPCAEAELVALIESLADDNRGACMTSLLGAGSYRHTVPQAVDQLLLRSELYTAYTPYQPEVAQGTLQIIFEFQTMVSEILGLPVANASMYDASTATAEAALMARRLTRRDRVLASRCVHPQYLATVRTYLADLDAGQPALDTVATTAGGAADLPALASRIDDATACVVVGYPSFYGPVCDLSPLAEAAHQHGAKLITVTGDPYALALTRPPGSLGADIAVAEGQPLGLPPQYGGPGVGLFACTAERRTLQQVPGRLVGETVDGAGKRGYVLTLATREQHIRRQRATSNICTNSGLCAAAVTIALAMSGKRGFIETAEQSLSKAQYLKGKIASLDGYRVASDEPTFNEFAVEVPGGDASRVVDQLAAQGILAGLPLGGIDPDRAGQLLMAVTELHTREQLEATVAALAGYQP